MKKYIFIATSVLYLSATPVLADLKTSVPTPTYLKLIAEYKEINKGNKNLDTDLSIFYLKGYMSYKNESFVEAKNYLNAYLKIISKDNKEYHKVKDLLKTIDKEEKAYLETQRKLQEQKEKLEKLAKLKAEAEAKARAEAEAKARAEAEAKARAEAKAKAKAEAKARAEAKAKAEKLAKEKAEKLAKEKAQQEGKYIEQMKKYIDTSFKKGFSAYKENHAVTNSLSARNCKIEFGSSLTHTIKNLQGVWKEVEKDVTSAVSMIDLKNNKLSISKGKKGDGAKKYTLNITIGSKLFNSSLKGSTNNINLYFNTKRNMKKFEAGLKGYIDYCSK